MDFIGILSISALADEIVIPRGRRTTASWSTKG
jgi:hypothetical protein